MHPEQNPYSAHSAAADTLYQTVFDAMAEGVVVQSVDALVIRVNPAAVHILGITAQEMYGLSSFKSPLRAVHEDGSDLAGEDHPAVVTLRTRQPVSGFVMGVHRSDGTLVWISVNARLLTAADGAVQGVVTTFSDITALKLAESRARASEAQSKNILETAPIGMAIVAPSGEFIQVNQALCDLSGYDRDDFTRLNFYETAQADDWEQQMHMVQRLLAGEVISYQHEGRYARKDGVRVWISYTVSLLRDEQGAPRHYIVQVRDITERKAADQALQFARRQLRTLIDTLPAFVSMIDRDGRCVIANRHYTELTGIPHTEIEGVRYGNFLPPEFQAQHADWLGRCLDGEAVEFMVQHPRRDGTTLHMQGRYVPLREEGQINGAVLAVTDVSELKRTQLQLTQLNADLMAKVNEIHQLQLKLHEMAIRDALTGLHNRRFLDEQLPRELARARRLQQPLCVALGDIDHFKRLNDSYGHQAGDAVLRSLRQFFSGLVRESDLVCRWGGEEILIVMPDLVPEVALQRLDRMRAMLADEVILFGAHRLQITISFGIAVYEHGATIDDVIMAADKALYAAKAAGRNQCWLAAPTQAGQ
jgi:diguanylate cyclase (GGDEF)-like protein/PAS domain S-box-containing protein